MFIYIEHAYNMIHHNKDIPTQTVEGCVQLERQLLKIKIHHQL